MLKFTAIVFAAAVSVSNFSYAPAVETERVAHVAPFQSMDWDTPVKSAGNVPGK